MDYTCTFEEATEYRYQCFGNACLEQFRFKPMDHENRWQYPPKTASESPRRVQGMGVVYCPVPWFTLSCTLVHIVLYPGSHYPVPWSTLSCTLGSHCPVLWFILSCTVLYSSSLFTLSCTRIHAALYPSYAFLRPCSHCPFS